MINRMDVVAEFANSYHYTLDSKLELMINHPMVEDIMEFCYEKGVKDGGAEE